jgi:hypothetical protein
MLKAGSIYFAIFISLIITILLSILILCTFYSIKYIDTQVIKDQLISNVNSALVLSTRDTMILRKAGTIALNLFEGADEPQDVIIQNRLWGVYRIITCSSSYGSYSYSKSVLVGVDPESGEKVSLYLADMGRFLSISGRTSLVGNCYLPKLGLRPAYIEGQTFKGEQLVDGEIRNSNASLPAVDPITKKGIEDNFSDKLPENDSIIEFREIERRDSLEQSFGSRTLTCLSRDQIILGNSIFTGNIRIISEKAIYITKDFQCNDIIIQAPKIIINNDFRGSLQAFASDSIIVGEDCNLMYPSILSITNQNLKSVYLEIMKNTSLDGGVILFQDGKSSNSSFLKINEGVEIEGQVFWPAAVEMLGTMKGPLYCQSFVLHTFNGSYNDYLLGATINRKLLNEYFAYANLLKDYPYGKEIKWVN